jgi:hypothetical protein
MTAERLSASQEGDGIITVRRICFLCNTRYLQMFWGTLDFCTLISMEYSFALWQGKVTSFDLVLQKTHFRGN